MDKYWKQIGRQNFENEYSTFIEFAIPVPCSLDITDLDDKLLYWNEDYIAAKFFDFIIDGDKFLVGEVVDVYFLGNLSKDILERDLEDDWGTSAFIITEKRYFYNNVDYTEEGEEIKPLSCPKPSIFYKIKPYY